MSVFDHVCPVCAADVPCNVARDTTGSPLPWARLTIGNPLPNFTRPTCVKCTGTNIGTAYCSGDGYDHNQRHSTRGSHLRKTCRTCSYGWDVPCADARVAGS